MKYFAKEFLLEKYSGNIMVLCGVNKQIGHKPLLMVRDYRKSTTCNKAGNVNLVMLTRKEKLKSFSGL